MRIESLRLKNYKVFRDIHLQGMPAMCVFVGANGAGKSTLFEVFGFLKRALAGDVGRALGHASGYEETVSRGQSAEGVEIELQIRMEIAGRPRLVTYLLEIALRDGRPAVRREVLRYKRGAAGRPFNFIDFRWGSGTAVSNEEDFARPDTELEREPQQLDSPDMLAIKGLGQFQRFKAATAFRQLLEAWQVSDLHMSRARESIPAEGDDEHLSASGDNLQRVANHLLENHPARFQQAIEAMQRRVPGVAEVRVEQSLDRRLLLQFRDGAFEDPFLGSVVSDGTLKMFAYLMLLYDPRPVPLLCVEEPENQLYPTLLPELCEEFRGYAIGGGQVFCSTHSPEFLDAVEIEELFVLRKLDGFTCIDRATELPGVPALVAEGEPLGALWGSNLLGDVHPGSVI